MKGSSRVLLESRFRTPSARQPSAEAPRARSAENLKTLAPPRAGQHPLRGSPISSSSCFVIRRVSLVKRWEYVTTPSRHGNSLFEAWNRRRVSSSIERRRSRTRQELIEATHKLIILKRGIEGLSLRQGAGATSRTMRRSSMPCGPSVSSG